LKTTDSQALSEERQDGLRLALHYLEYLKNQGLEEVLLSPRPRPIGRPTLEGIRDDLGDCKRCPLHETRMNIVFGEGDPQARLMFIGEGPGADEDRQGRPFVGKAGQLLTKMIRAMNLERSQVYIANVVKCRPPGNRDPQPVEIRTCRPFLDAQIDAIAPEVIVALGRVAACTLLEAVDSISKLRGRVHERQGIPIIPTYHPSFLLREDSGKRFKAEAWADLKMAMGLLGLSAGITGDRE
jgi:uracil-DNA glycosylase